MQMFKEITLVQLRLEHLHRPLFLKNAKLFEKNTSPRHHVKGDSSAVQITSEYLQHSNIFFKFTAITADSSEDPTTAELCH